MNNFIVEHVIDNLQPIYEINNFFNREVQFGLARRGTVGLNEERPEIKSSLEVFLNLDKQLEQMYYHEILEPAVNKYFDLFPESAEQGKLFPNEDDINIQEYEPNSQGYAHWHYERTEHKPRRVFAFITYLNTVKDGGETKFKYQNVSVKPQIGKTIIFPADWTHLHMGLSSPTETKRIVTGWLSFERM